MSQPSGYQYQPYQSNPGSLKAAPSPMVNGEPNITPHAENGIQSPPFSGHGTPSAQSSRDPSREPSRDPSPTHNLHNQYRSHALRSSPMPPINGQQNSSKNPTVLPQRMGQMQNYSPSGTPPPIQSIQSNIGSSVSNSPMSRPPYTSPQPLKPPNFQSAYSPSSVSTSSQIQSMAEPLNQSFQLPPGQPKAPVDDSASLTSSAALINTNPSTTIKQVTAPLQNATSFALSSGHIQTAIGQTNRTNQNLQPNLQSQSNRPSIGDQYTSSDVAKIPPITHTAAPSLSQPSSGIVSQPNSGQPLQTPHFSAPDQQRSSTQNIFAPATSNPALSSNTTNFTAQPIYSSTQNLFGSTQNVQTSSQNVLGTVQTAIPSTHATQYPTQNLNPRSLPNLPGSQTQIVSPTAIPSAQTTQYSTQNPNQRSLPSVPGSQTQFVTPAPPSTQYSTQNPIQTNSQSLSGLQTQHVPPVPLPTQYTNPYSNPRAVSGSQPNLSGPPTTINQSQNLYSSHQNLASQRKYPQNPYGIQPQIGTGNTSGPNLVSQKSGIPPTGSVGLGQYQSGSVQQGMPPLPVQQPPNQYATQPQHPGQMSNVPLDNMAKRYPSAYPDQMNQLNSQMSGMNVANAGFNQLWGMESIDLLQNRNVLPAEKVEPPKVRLQQEFLDSVNCSPDIFRCTLTKIPETNSLLKKTRLPLGVLIHPFKDLNHLPVIQCSTIVRCRACRTYINPFVYFVDSKRWKCNLCYRVNELPEEFQFDPVTKSYGDPSRRPEVKTSTIEFIAPSEYMLRPPQPAVYLFVFDVSRLAVESGYLSVVCNTILNELSRLPGDSRTQVGFLAVDSALHFFSMPDNVSQPHEMIMLDVDDVFLPCPDNLIVNLKEREELVKDLLVQLPVKFQGTHDTNCALGAGLQTAFKLMSPTGGRVTVFQTCLPNLGPGLLQSREDPNNRSGKDVPHLNPATDFYKRIALDCSGQQIAVDLFLLNSQYSDMATLSGMCKFSGGCMYHVPLFRVNKPQHSDILERMLRRYLTRKIGFEAVMRIRCTRGLSIDTFHGNFFVRSTDLLSLPNVNPDAGFGMQVAIEENLSDVQSVCFQAALLYTSSKGERRIRVHTLCLPVVANLSDVLHSADQQCIAGLLAKMAVDRSQQSSLSDARDALINVAIDVLSAYKLLQSIGSGSLLAPGNLKLLPLYIIALLKCMAFRSGTSTRLDDRVFAMCQMKALPLSHLIQNVYPDLYAIHALDDENAKDIDGKICPQPSRLHLSAEKLDSRGAFTLDAGDKIFIYVGKNIHPSFCSNVLGVQAFPCIPEEMYELPELETPESERVRNFIFSLQEEKPFYASLQIIREDSHFRQMFTERLIEDRIESALSYYEFLQHLKTRVK